MDEKTCTTCGETRPLAEFGRRGVTKTGRVRWKSACKACCAATEKKRLAASGEGRPTRAQILAAQRERSAALIEDVEFMLTHRESMHMAAQRLSIKAETLERFLERHGRYELATALKRNQYEYTSSPKKEW